jgi:hypothetical protein
MSCSSDRAQTFQRDILPPSSGSKSKPSKNPAEAGGKPSSGWCHLLCGLDSTGYAEEIFWRQDHADGIVATRSPDLTSLDYMEPGDYQERYYTVRSVGLLGS